MVESGTRTLLPVDSRSPEWRKDDRDAIAGRGEVAVDTLDTYLKGEYLGDQADVDRLLRLSERATDTLVDPEAFDGEVWRYLWLDESNQVLPRTDAPSKPKVSHSTTAMISFALEAATAPKFSSPLVPGVSVRTGGLGKSERDRAEARHLKVDAAVRQAIRALVLDVGVGQDPPLLEELHTKSNTFGTDDPFTLTWLIGLGPGFLGNAWDPLLRTVTSRVLTAFSAFESSHAVLRLPRRTKRTGKANTRGRVDKTAPQEVPHAFTILRFVQLNRALKAWESKSGMVNQLGLPVSAPRLTESAAVRDWLRNRVYMHLSLSALPGSSFDPADMVLALEGMQLLGSPDIALVRRVLEVLASRQETSEYWRPLLPFTANEQGLVLLPQSIEVANSLLRICDHLYDTEPTLFSEHLPLFRRYASWLESRAHLVGDGQGVGWESEHTYQGDRIHLWQTSQALLFIRSYVSMLQRHMADVSLLAAGLAAKKMAAPPEKTDDPRKRGNAGQQPSPDVYDARTLIWNDVVDMKSIHSLILSGPPGTGKTKLAQDIARAKGFRFVTITPSDIAAAGQEGIEARAKAIFTTLGLQARVVVLFDEIDQLLLDRESRRYRRQSDVFKLMTPGMLVKINDLVKNEDNIYILATNYVDHIDPAITRPGRFGAQYVILPPWQDARVVFVRGEFGGGEEIPRLSQELESASLYTYAELELAAKKTVDRPSGGASLAGAYMKELAKQPRSIRILSYKKRCGRAPDEPSRAQILARTEAALVAAVLFEPMTSQSKDSAETSAELREVPAWLVAAIDTGAASKDEAIGHPCARLRSTLEKVKYEVPKRFLE